MILPIGHVVHKDMGTAYIDLDLLLNELRANQFTGYMSLRSWKYEAAIFMDSGNLSNVIEEEDSHRRTGTGAMDSVRKHGKARDGIVNVYQLDADLVWLIAGSTQRAALFERSSSDLIPMDRLMSRLETENRTGHVEVLLGDRSAGLIFMLDGKPLSAFYTANGSTIFGSESIAKMSELACHGAMFNVYRSDPTVSLGQDFVSLELIATWQGLLALVEKNVDAAAGSGTFSMDFKRGCLENLNAYPFLDPFEDGFEFKNGHLKFEGGANQAQFTAGVASALRFVPKKLNAQGARAYQMAIRNASQEQHAQLEAWGILAAIGESTDD